MGEGGSTGTPFRGTRELYEEVGRGRREKLYYLFPLTFKATHQSGLLYGGDENSLLKFPP
jgi:hypothetical protein